MYPHIICIVLMDNDLLPDSIRVQQMQADYEVRIEALKTAMSAKDVCRTLAIMYSFITDFITFPG